MFITFSECQELPSSTTVKIRSSGYSVYSVEVMWSGARKLLSEDGLRAKQFDNITSIKDCLRQLPIEKALLVHTSPYDEMIGQAISQDNELCIPVNLKTMY